MTTSRSSRQSSTRKPSRQRSQPSPAAAIAPDTVVLIERLADDGRGIASVNGHTIFVAGALPDEQVTITITRSSARYSEGRVKQLMVASDDRQQPMCPVFSRCGGCSLQHLSTDKHVLFKQRTVLSQLARWSSISPQSLLPPIAINAYQYRQRVRLAVDYNKLGEVLFGFREADSRAIVNTTQCDVLTPALQRLLPLLRDGLCRIARVVSHIELIHTDSGIGIVVRHTRSLSVDDRQVLLCQLQASSGAPSDKPPIQLWFQGKKGARLSDVQHQAVTPLLSYTLPSADVQPLHLQFHPQDFIQSNSAVNQAMVAQALALLAPQAHEVVVDLFCGIGNFSLPIAQKAKQVIGVEGVEQMVARATENAAHNNISNAAFITQDLSQPIDVVPYLRCLAQQAQSDEERLGESHTSTIKVNRAPKKKSTLAIDALVLDPPRAGAKAVCEQINELSPQRIVYVSCDSSTFARDAGILAKQGYCMTQLGVMDMFPQTSHVEIMALFVVDSTRHKGKPHRSAHHSTTRSSSPKKTIRKLTLG